MKNNRNSLFSSTLTYLVIFLILIAGFGYFMRGNSGSASEQIKSSEFIADLKQNDVKDFSIQPVVGSFPNLTDHDCLWIDRLYSSVKFSPKIVVDFTGHI